VRRDNHRCELALGEVIGQRRPGESADFERRQALQHDLGDPLVVRRRERTDRVDDDVAAVEVVAEIARSFADVARRHREHDEPRFVREPPDIGRRLERRRQHRSRQARGMARASDRVDDGGIARPQDHASAGARQHRRERGAEPTGADDADGVCSLAHTSTGMCAVRFW
jgi:hypothetical protein